MQIFIKAITNKTFVMDVTLSTQIKKVKEYISDNVNLPYAYQILYLNYTHLANDLATLADYNIMKDSTITCKLDSFKAARGRKIFIKPPSKFYNRIRHVYIHDELKVSELISLIKRLYHYDNNFYLYYYTLDYYLKLNNKGYLGDYNIRKNQAIHVSFDKK